MKKILSILSTISLSTIISTNIIACKTSNTNNENNKPIESEFIPQQPPENSNWKLVNNYNQLETKNSKWYIMIYSSDPKIISKLKNDENRKIYLFNLNSNTGIRFGNSSFSDVNKISLYYWDGNDEPTIPTINRDTGEITNWNEKIETK
ncbi:lipoprotein [Spiroplasma endosymbiont of Polydrusus pterygomalis]|uniref:lipoprotein n=1 Tax=Spiroplasma endosymbiont of Polydrusus pterygomalis TaxID=3139327 RepID=UPI003CCB619E